MPPRWAASSFSLRPLQQQLLVDQCLERGLAQQTIIQSGRIEALTQLLLQLATLHFHGLGQLRLLDLVAVDQGDGALVTRGADDRFEAGQRHQQDDESDDDFGNPSLRTVPDVL